MIKSIESISNNLNYRFIDNKKESILDSINSSKYCFWTFIILILL